MALGKRKHEQQEAWVATTDLPKSPGHPFYRKLNRTAGRGRLRRLAGRRCAGLITPIRRAATRFRRARTSA